MSYQAVNIRTTLQVNGYLENKSIVPLPAAKTPEYEELDPSGQPLYIITETIDSYNDFMQKSDINKRK